MIVKFGTDSVDLDSINSLDDLHKWLDNLPGQDKSVLSDKPERSVRKDEIVFDECTGKEIAIRNLSYALSKEYKTLKEKVFPASVTNLVLLANQQGNADMVSIPAVNTEDYATLQKLSYFGAYLDQYMALLIQSRVGFGLNLSLRNDGRIYCLTDLRKLHSLMS